MDPFEKGVQTGKILETDEKAYLIKNKKLGEEAVNRISNQVEDKFLKAGYDFRVKGSSITINFCPINSTTVDIMVDARLPRDASEVYFSSHGLELYASVGSKDQLSENRLMEALGELFGKTSMNVMAHKEWNETMRLAHERNLKDERRKLYEADSAKNIMKLLFWIGVPLVLFSIGFFNA